MNVAVIIHNSRLLARTAAVAGTLCVLSWSDLTAADLDMRQLAASEPSVEKVTRIGERQRLSQSIVRYEGRKAELFRQAIIREESDRLPTDFLQSTVSALAVAIPGVTVIAGASAVGSVLSATLPEVSRKLLNRHMDENFKQILIEMRTKDEEFYKQLYTQLLNSPPDSADRARLLARAIDASSINAQMLRGVANEEQRLHLLEYQADQIQGLLGRNFREDAAFRDVVTRRLDQLEEEIGRFDVDGQREQVLAVGKELRVINSNRQKLVDETSDLQQRLRSHNERMGSTIASMRETVASTRRDVERLGEVVVQQGRTLTEHEKILTEQGKILNEHGEQIGAHEVRLNDLEGEVVNLDRAYDQLSDDVQFNQSLLYGTLPASAKIQALKNPNFLRGHFPDEETRNEVIERLEMQETAREVLSATRDVQVGTHALANILLQTDIISVDDAREAREVVDTVGGLVSVGVSVYSGNVVGVLTGVSGLLGGGGRTSAPPNPQVMAALGEISETLRDITAGQAEIRKGQEQLLDGQRTIIEQLGEVEETMITRFDEIGHSITEVQWELGQIRETLLVHSYLGVLLDACEDFANSRGRYGLLPDEGMGYKPVMVEFATGEFGSWNDLDRHYTNYRRQWEECMFGMRTLFASRNEVHSAFRMASYTDDKGTGFLTGYIKPGLEPLLRLMTRHYPLDAGSSMDGGGMRTFCTLLNSPLVYDGIDHRGYVPFRRNEEEYCRSGSNTTSINPLQALGAPPGNWLIHPDVLAYFAYLLMEILPYRELIDDTGDLRAPQVVAFQDSEVDQEVSKDLMETAYRLVSFAIAQQILMTGDIFLPLIHGYVFSSSASPDDRKDMIGILKHNKHIARNYLIMQLRRELQLRTRQGDDPGETGSVFSDNIKLYETIFQCRTGARRDCGEQGYLGYERLFATYWSFSPNTNHVVLSAGGGPEPEQVELPLPAPREIASGTYQATRQYEELVRLLGKIIDYAFRNDLQLFSDQWEVMRDGHFVWH